MLAIQNSQVENAYIKKALAVSEFSSLTLEQYIYCTKYPVDKFMVDNFFHHLDKNINIYVTPSFLEYFGYSGETRKQKEVFLGTLKNNFESGSDYWILNNDEYKNFYDQVSKNISKKIDANRINPEDPAHDAPSIDTEVETIKSPKFPDPFDYIGKVGKGKTKHVILTVPCFKEFLMILTTSKAKQVRKFYLMLEELINDYAKYQALWLQTDAAKKDARIDALIKDLRNSNRIAEENGKKLDISNQRLEASNKKLDISNRRLDESNKKLAESNRKLGISNMKLEELTEQLEITGEEMESQGNVLNKKIDKISDKLGVSVKDRVLQPQDARKQEKFVLYEINDPNVEYTHYTARVKISGANRANNRVIQNHPDAKIILEITATPNAKILYENIKENIREPEYNLNYIRIPADWTSERFVQFIMEVYESRKVIDL